MARFVEFPGTAGSFADKPNVNQLDADTANMVQSVGTWVQGSGASAIVLDTDLDPVPQFGPNTTKITANNATALLSNGTAPTGLAGDQTLSLWVYTLASDREAFLRYAGTSGSSGAGALTPGVWKQISVTVNGPATGALEFQYRVASTDLPAPNAEDVWISGASLDAASSPPSVFLPSFRIVGDLEMSSDIRAVDYSPAAEPMLISNRSGVTGYHLALTAAGGLFVRHGDGVTDRGQVSIAHGLVDGTRHTIKATWTNATGDWDYIIDGVSFDGDAGGTTADGVSPGSNIAAGAFFNGAANNFEGAMYFAEARDGIGGPVVVRFDAEDIPAT